MSRFQSICKAITWRFIASGTTFCVGWVITRDPTASLGLASVDGAIKMVFYYMHERAWARSSNE